MKEAVSCADIKKNIVTEENEALAQRILQAATERGVEEFFICPGARNVPLLEVLNQNPNLKTVFGFEERSTAFFALGRSRATQKPVAVITTSGTAVGELLPAAMEAYYTGVPLLLLTADRPRRFRGSGAPQTAEQEGLFGQYSIYDLDCAQGEPCDLSNWSLQGPSHLNVCFEEPSRFSPKKNYKVDSQQVETFLQQKSSLEQRSTLLGFLESVKYPLVVVSSIKHDSCLSLVEFLVKLNAPVYLEGVSCLREHPGLQHIRITRSDHLWNAAKQADYPIDGILRIGSVPTFRLWRDLEDKQHEIRVCSISENPFSGLSWGSVLHVSIHDLLSNFAFMKSFKSFSSDKSTKWIKNDRIYWEKLEQLFKLEAHAEPSLFYQLSRRIPKKSLVYLGNSMPIREWDLAATSENRNFEVHANRGLNGIDGQISTFLGLCKPEVENWAIIGDLTALYDLAGPWMLSQLKNVRVNIVIINNGGGKIFSRMFENSAIQNCHQLNFEGFAKLWNLKYERWTQIPESEHMECNESRVIEIVPDEHATGCFWNSL